MRGHAVNARKHVFHLAGEHVRPANDEHIVAARTDLLHPCGRAAALAGLRNHARQVMRAITQNRNSLLVERGEDQLAHLAIGNRLAGFRVNHFPQEMILGDVLHIAFSKALARHARSHDLGQAVIVRANDMHTGFDFGLETRRARLSAEQTDAQRGGLPVVAHLLADFADMHGVRRRSHQHRRAIILDHLDLALSVARAGRDHHAAKTLQAVMQAETAGEHAVPERHLHAIGRHDARHLHQSHDAIVPNVHVMAVIAHHDGLSRGARRRMELHNLVQRHGEHAIGKRLAQRMLIGEGKLAHVLQALDVGRLHAHLVHLVAIPRNSLIGPLHLRNQFFELNSADALARTAFHIRVMNGQLIEATLRGRAKRCTLFRDIDHETTPYLTCEVRQYRPSCEENPSDQAAQRADRPTASPLDQGL